MIDPISKEQPSSVPAEVMPEKGHFMPTAKEAGTFILSRGFDNAVWIGSVAAGLYVESTYGVPVAVVAPATAAMVATVEYGMSGYTTNLMAANEDTSEQTDKRQHSAVVSEALALLYASYNGATSTPEINNSLGLATTKQRRLGQAAIYGVGVSLWTTDIPPFSWVRDHAITGAIEQFGEDPARAATVSVAVSAGIFGLAKGFKATREWFSKRKQAPEEITDTTS